MSSEGEREQTWHVPLNAKQDTLPMHFHFSRGDKTSIQLQGKLHREGKDEQGKEEFPYQHL